MFKYVIIFNVMKRWIFLYLFGILCPCVSFADSDILQRANDLYDATRAVCMGISDEIARVGNVSRANTVVTAAGTVASGGALVSGIQKSKQDERVNQLVKQICSAGGCDADSISAMSNADFFANVLQPMSLLADSQRAELQQELDRSKKLGNWRTALTAGALGTNIASAVLSGVNRDQSELAQHISACNNMVKSVSDLMGEIKSSGINPYENPIVKKLDDVQTWCGQIKLDDIEKIENRLKGVLGTSITGAAIGVAGVVTSAAANSDKYTDASLRVALSQTEQNQGRALNIAANVMAGAGTATGIAGTGLNISLITLTKKLITQSDQCEGVLK